MGAGDTARPPKIFEERARRVFVAELRGKSGEVQIFHGYECSPLGPSAAFGYTETGGGQISGRPVTDLVNTTPDSDHGLAEEVGVEPTSADAAD